MKKYIRTNDITNLEPVMAMALINPQLSNTLTISPEVVQGGEGPVPHIHIYLDKSRSKTNCAYVLLCSPQYAKHHKNGKHLSKSQKAEFIRVMSEPWDGYIIKQPDGTYRPATGYEAAVHIWVDTYEHGDFRKFAFDSDGNLIMPNYKLL